MKSNSFLDYSACILFRILGGLFRFLPVELSFFIGRRVGDWFYCFDFKHRARTYANIRFAVGRELACGKVSRITREFYRSFGESLIEIFLIPKVGKAYMSKYIEIEGLENIYMALEKGRGALLTAVHAGGWELANIICANCGFPFYLFVKEQGFPRLNALLNKYRRQKGCQIITREGGLKQLIEALKNNAAVGITLDQGGKSGELIDFFGRTASMSTGGIKLALKYNSPVVPVYFLRKHGPYIKVIVGKELELSHSGDTEKDIRENLSRFIRYFEGLIRVYPKEYLWTYKIWKYSDQKDILILSDGKAGHLRQAEALGCVVRERLEHKGMRVETNTVELQFRNGFSRTGLALSSLFTGKYYCQGCLRCLRKFLKPDTYKQLEQLNPDVIISCGSSTAAVNFILARETLARSITALRPGILSLRRFDLVVMPQHDHPPKRKNVAVTRGALNLIDQHYLKEQSEALAREYGLDPHAGYIGLLIGGSTKEFILKKELIVKLADEIKAAAKNLGAAILLTTSRRTPAEVEELLKQEFKGYPACKLLVIANEKNIPQAVGGILGLSKIAVISPESISMVSEAASSAKYVVVFKATGLRKRHAEFLDGLAGDNYIYLSPVQDLRSRIEDIWRNTPPLKVLQDREVVAKAVEKIF